MSTMEIIALIDAILAMPVTSSAKHDLRSFRSQIEAGTISDDDQNYVISFCERLKQQNGGQRDPSILYEGRISKAVEENSEQIISREREAFMFESTRDLMWLYFSLKLGERLDEYKLKDFVLDYGEERLIKEACKYVEAPWFHCTALRDLFVVRLLEQILEHIGDDPVQKKKNWKDRSLLIAGLIVTVPFAWIYISWWCAILVIAIVLFLARRWHIEYESNAHNRWSDRYFSKMHSKETMRHLISRVREGGFDEPVLIEQIEFFDMIKNPPGSAVPLRAGRSIRAPFLRPEILPVVIPDVLYALLRTPRRNVEYEISEKFFALDKTRRDKLYRDWLQFVDSVNY